MLFLLALSLYGLYRFLRARRRARQPGFISNNSPSLFSWIFGTRNDTSQFYNPVNQEFGFEDQDFSVEFGRGNSSAVGKSKLRQPGVSDDDEILQWAEENVEYVLF